MDAADGRVEHLGVSVRQDDHPQPAGPQAAQGGDHIGEWIETLDLGNQITHLLSLVSSRYERASLIVTSNKPFSAWARSSATRSPPP
jgi:hypothetical protein